MPEPLKKFRVTMEFELAVNPITRDDFTRVMDDTDDGFIDNHMSHQQALQAAILNNPEVLKAYLRTRMSGFIEAEGVDVGMALFDGENYDEVEKAAIAKTPEPTKSFFQEALDEGQIAENTEQLSNSFVITPITGSITEV